MQQRFALRMVEEFLDCPTRASVVTEIIDCEHPLT
jgi:hypothetical protein